MTGEELFLNELNIHIINGVSKKDLTDLIKERVKQLTISDVSDNERSDVAVCPKCGGKVLRRMKEKTYCQVRNCRHSWAN